MIICYYTKENGKIYNCHTNNGKSYDELKTMSDDFNIKSKTSKVHIVEVEDDGLTAYLMERFLERKKYSNESLSEIRNTLNELDDMITNLFRSEQE